MIALLAAFFCIAANAFFVAAEFAMAKVRPTALEALAKNGDASAKSALYISKRLGTYLTATQFGITLASLGLGWVGEPAVAHYVEMPLRLAGATTGVVHAVGLAIAFAVITLLHIVVGELVPKSFAIQRADLVARRTALIIRVFYVVAYPLLVVLGGASALGLRLLGLPSTLSNEGPISLEELRLVVKDALQEDEAGPQKRELLERVLRSADRPVRAFMVPRVDMVHLSLSDDFASAFDQMRKLGFSRFPLSDDGNPDRIVGYVHAKDLLFASDGMKDGLRRFRRDIFFVPESRTAIAVLEDFKRTKIPMAIVVDEYGGTSGLVTIEDVVEEIVGELQDEFDVETPNMQKRDDGSYVVNASMPIDELNLDGLVKPDLEGGETLAGLMVSMLGRLARPGDHVRLGRFDAIVDDVRRRRVARVLLVPITDDDENASKENDNDG